MVSWKKSNKLAKAADGSGMWVVSGGKELRNELKKVSGIPAGTIEEMSVFV